MEKSKLLKVLNEFIEKVEPNWKVMQNIADSHLSAVTKIYKTAFLNFQKDISIDELKIQSENAIIDAINWSRLTSHMQPIYDEIPAILIASGQAEAKYLLQNKTLIKKDDIVEETPLVLGAFDTKNPEAIFWVNQYVANEIANITEATRNGIREVIANAIEQQMTPYNTAKEIKKFIGLTKNQVLGIRKYREKLEEAGLSPEKIDKKIQKQTLKLISKRAEDIARTETISAACSGQQLHWSDQVRKGFLKSEHLVKIWITTPDDITCEFCKSLDGKTTEINGFFPGGIQTPSLHTRCRCAIGLVERKGQEISNF